MNPADNPADNRASNPADRPQSAFDERDPIRVKRNRMLRLVQDLHAGSFMWLSDILGAGHDAGLEAWETVRQLTKELQLAALVSVEWSPRSGEMPRAQDVLVTPVGDLHLPVVPGFRTRRAGKVPDKHKPFEADLLAGRDVCNLELIALAWEEEGRAEKREERAERPEERRDQEPPAP
jgi:hypothetical protein